MEKMCPLMCNRKYHEEACRKERCGWWNEADRCCAMVTLSNAAINLAEMAVGQRIIYTKEV